MTRPAAPTPDPQPTEEARIEVRGLPFRSPRPRPHECKRRRTGYRRASVALPGSCRRRDPARVPALPFAQIAATRRRRSEQPSAWLLPNVPAAVGFPRRCAE